MNKNLSGKAKSLALALMLNMGAVSPALLATPAYAATSTTTQISPLQLAQLLGKLQSNMAQRSLSTAEKALYQQLYSIANNQQNLFDPAISSPVQQYEAIRSKIRNQFNNARQLAVNTYGSQSQQKVLLAVNAFILMYYDALSRNNPKFYWSNLGVFVANDVRSNYALTFSLSNALDPLNITNSQNIRIAGMDIPTLQSTIMQANQILIGGQADVMVDIGGLAVLHQHYSAQLLAQQLAGYGGTLVTAFQSQQVADSYAATYGTNNATFKQLATTAAINLGIHEQEKMLQPMWDKPLMQTFAKINDFMLSLSLENIGLRGDIFIGVNKFKPSLLSPYLIIRAPIGATNLAALQDRIAIARNGFTVLNQWKQNWLYSPWIPVYQSQLGKGENLYQPVGAR
jgi:hypothetical protein